MQKIDVLQVGRALAALAVVAHHAGSSGAAFTSALPHMLEAVLALGYLGVDFFFVLSGFIIYHTTIDRPLGVSGLVRYAYYRTMRIFLPYWPISLSIAAVYTLMPMFGSSNRPWSWAETLTLLPIGEGTSLNVAWTLEHELVFYMIFGVGLLMRRPLAVIGAWLLLVTGAASLGHWPGTPSFGPREILLGPINLEFGMGIAAALWYRSGRSIPLGIVMVGVISPVGLWLLFGAPREASLLVGISFAVLMAWATGRERVGALPSCRFLSFLGGASYAIYLIHTPLISLTSRLADTWPQALLGGLTLSVAAGVIYHFSVERPLLALADRRQRRHQAVAVI